MIYKTPNELVKVLIWDLTFYFMAKTHILLKTQACVAKHGCEATTF